MKHKHAKQLKELLAYQAQQKLSYVMQKRRGWPYQFATLFGVGRSKIAPGTMGSLATLPIFWLVIEVANDILEMQALFTIIAVLLFCFGTLAVSRLQKETGSHDDPSIVIDEVLGMMVASAVGLPYAVKLANYFYVDGLHHYIVCFLLIFLPFRFFDITKPWIIGYIDAWRSALSVLLDDVFAGIAAGLFLIVTWEIWKLTI